jgi:hypothetical protein
MEERVLEKFLAVFHPITLVPEEVEAIEARLEGEGVSRIKTVG